jgi:ParB family chromosome partitioning protein
MSTEKNFLEIPLAKLEVSPSNVRKTDADKIDDLLGSIPVHGLLQSLVIVPGDKAGHYHVIAGGRRLRALQSLAKSKKLPKGYLVPCRLAEDGQDHEQLSLAENAIRAAMHPADQFEAFAAQIDAGKNIADVAQAFGVSETIVKKRLKLGRVAPEILAAFRADELNLDQVAAYAITDDQERQRDVFASNPNAHSNMIRNSLTQGEVPASDSRVRFVGLETYTAAGGAIHHDLFAEGDRGTFLTDVALLDRLAAEKTEALIAEVKAEGWKDVFLFEGQYWQLSEAYKGRIYPQPIELSAEDQETYDALVARMEEIEAELEQGDSDELRAEYEQLSHSVDQFKTTDYLPDEKATASAAIVKDYNGNIKIERGLLKAASKTSSLIGEERPASADGLPAPSAKMQTELGAVRTAAIAADLCDNTHVALAVTVHSLASTYFGLYANVSATTYKGERADAAGQIQNRKMRPLAVLDERQEALRERLPERPADWWPYFLEMSHDDLMQHLALFTALSLRPFGQFALSSAKVHGDQIAEALGTKPETWVTLSDLEFLSRSRKSAILAAVEKIKGKDRAENISGLKKADLVERATAELDGKWLPAELSGFASETDRAVTASMDARSPYSHYYNEDQDEDDEEIDLESNEGEDGTNLAA